MKARSVISHQLTYDFDRMMDGATKLKCSEFGDAIIKHMKAITAGARKFAMAMA